MERKPFEDFSFRAGRDVESWVMIASVSVDTEGIRSRKDRFVVLVHKLAMSALQEDRKPYDLATRSMHAPVAFCLVPCPRSARLASSPPQRLHHSQLHPSCRSCELKMSVPYWQGA